jgi:anti-sigma factor RsiW
MTSYLINDDIITGRSTVATITRAIDPELEAEALDMLERLDADCTKAMEELKTTDPGEYLSRLNGLVQAMQADQREERDQQRLQARRQLKPVRKQALARLLKIRGVKSAAALRRP